MLRLNITPQILSTYSSPLPWVPHSLPISSFLQVFLPNLYAYSSPLLCVSHSLPISSILQVFHRNSVPIVIHSRACHIPCPSHLFGFYHSNNFWRVWKISRPFTEFFFFKPLRTVRISKRIFCSAVFVRCWSLSRGTATEINYACLHTAFEGWKVRGEVHGLVLIWTRETFSGTNGVIRSALSVSSWEITLHLAPRTSSSYVLVIHVYSRINPTNSPSWSAGNTCGP